MPALQKQYRLRHPRMHCLRDTASPHRNSRKTGVVFLDQANCALDRPRDLLPRHWKRPSVFLPKAGKKRRAVRTSRCRSLLLCAPCGYCESSLCHHAPQPFHDTHSLRRALQQSGIKALPLPILLSLPNSHRRRALIPPRVCHIEVFQISPTRAHSCVPATVSVTSRRCPGVSFRNCINRRIIFRVIGVI